MRRPNPDPTTEAWKPPSAQPLEIVYLARVVRYVRAFNRKRLLRPKANLSETKAGEKDSEQAQGA
jgi:hypothetical protein